MSAPAWVAVSAVAYVLMWVATVRLFVVVRYLQGVRRHGPTFEPSRSCLKIDAQFALLWPITLPAMLVVEVLPLALDRVSRSPLTRPPRSVRRRRAAHDAESERIVRAARVAELEAAADLSEVCSLGDHDDCVLGACSCPCHGEAA